MNTFDYGSEAELFVASGTFAVKKALRYIPFILASDAIRYAMEELASARRGGICLEVNDERFDSTGIRRLYESEAYPLRRKSSHGKKEPGMTDNFDVAGVTESIN